MTLCLLREAQNVRYDKCLVYNPRLAFPKYIIHYTTADITAVDIQTFHLRLAGNDDTLKVHTPKENRTPKLDDPLELHYRIVESQFLRLMAYNKKSLQIESVDYYINPPLVRKFSNKCTQFKAKYGDVPEGNYVLAFHGTDSTNINGIVKENFRVDKIARSMYGKGFYFSEDLNISVGYGNNLLLCQILPGRSYICPGPQAGAKCMPGYDSHVDETDSKDRGQRIAIFDPDQILPCYFIKYKQL